MATHDDIKAAVEKYIAESEAFESKGVKAAATRARAALNDLGKLTKVRRKEIQDKKKRDVIGVDEWLKVQQHHQALLATE